MSFDFDVGSFFIGLSVAVILYLLYGLLCSLYNILFPYVFLRPVNLHKKAGAKWAVVTGATDGIGRAYAFELARKGFNIVLISRTQQKLDDTCLRILQDVPAVEVESFAFDLSTGSSSDYKPLVDYLQQKHIGILVNNVGGIADYPEILHKMEGGIPKMGQQLAINMLPPTLLSAAVLPQMVARKAGIIVNVSSAASYWQFKEWALYAASKKYVSWLTAILQREYADYGITIQCLNPMLVTTKLSKIETPSFFGPDPDAYVKQAIRSIGHAKETTGYIAHQIQYEGSSITPSVVLDYVIERKNRDLKEKAQQKWAE